ncbi:Oxo-4-hydroxy-4-carboxy-5-ureidoimidazoline decarboxylase [Cladochytrium replicatum]|nr:Oxo-4-hydroxy-4-carboxy-5-ureidoimidazoline decarboxylase [Cladochytrium replicatum]
MSLPPIQSLNDAPREDFVAAINLLFETAPPLAEKLFASRPFDSYTSLIDLTSSWILSNPTAFSQDDLMAIINAHPRIGAPKHMLSAQSYNEQGYTTQPSGAPPPGEEDDRVNAELSRLNVLYEENYGFKFVEFVAGRPRSAILEVLRHRLENGERENELSTGLKAMMEIARDRLKKL